MTTSTHLLRNVAIIAHVDHGKTTLVDSLLAFCGTLRPNEAQPVCVLDSDPQERERGITIFSKNCAVNYAPTTGPNAGSTYRVNIIDTPGHADFGGEVERVLRMADGVLLLVDAFEGPMPQTRFVLSKALELGLRPLVVLNKVDRPEARCDDVIDEIFDLLIDLGADDEMLEFDVIYASGRDGWAATSLDGERTTIQPILDEIVERVPHPSDDPTAPLQMLITTLDYSEYVGRIAIGRVYAGTLTAGSSVAICRADDKVERVRVQKLHQFAGLGRMEVSEIHAGDLCAVEGIGESFDLGDTIADPERPVALPRVAVDEPTLHMLFRVNDSPFAGREGKFVTSRQLADRLQRETQANVALRVETGASPEEFQVSGRGLLHLSVLIENMRREGYELSVGRPDVIERVIDGTMCEPIERLTIDVRSELVGPALELLGTRGGEILSMDPRGERMHVISEIPARGLIGLRSRMLTATQGEAIMAYSFARYAPVRTIERRRGNGVLVATETGPATSFSLLNLSERAVMFVRPQEPVYAGQVVGENSRDNDLDVNVAKAKAFSNVRESTKEATVTLKAPRDITLELALEYIESDELVEVTPAAIRIRKRLLSENERKRAMRRERQKVADRV